MSNRQCDPSCARTHKSRAHAILWWIVGVYLFLAMCSAIMAASFYAVPSYPATHPALALIVPAGLFSIVGIPAGTTCIWRIKYSHSHSNATVRCMSLFVGCASGFLILIGLLKVATIVGM